MFSFHPQPFGRVDSVGKSTDPKEVFHADTAGSSLPCRSNDLLLKIGSGCLPGLALTVFALAAPGPESGLLAFPSGFPGAPVW